MWICLYPYYFSSIMSNSLQPHGLQHTRLPCLSPTPEACSNSCLLSQWCHPTIPSSAIPFSSCLQSFTMSRTSFSAGSRGWEEVFNHYPQVICSVLGGQGTLTQVLLRRKEKLGQTTVVCRHVELFLETRALTGAGVLAWAADTHGLPGRCFMEQRKLLLASRLLSCSPRASQALWFGAASTGSLQRADTARPVHTAAPPARSLGLCLSCIYLSAHSSPIPPSSSLQDQTPSLLPCRLLRLLQDPIPSLSFIFSSFYFLKLLFF